MSLGNYLCYMGFLLVPTFHENHPVKATLHSFGEIMSTHLFWYLLNTIMYSFLAPVDYAPFNTDSEAHHVFWSLELRHLCNNFVAAVLVSLSLSFSLSGVSALVQLVGGFQCEHVVDNPMFQSSSPSDFWGRRWNRLIHVGLKVRKKHACTEPRAKMLIHYTCCVCFRMVFTSRYGSIRRPGVWQCWRPFLHLEFFMNTCGGFFFTAMSIKLLRTVMILLLAKASCFLDGMVFCCWSSMLSEKNGGINSLKSFPSPSSFFW